MIADRNKIHLDKMSLADQPIELIIQQLGHLPVEQILNLCQTDTKMASICNRRDFWMALLIRDFPDAYRLYGPNYPNMRNLYRRVYEKQRKELPIEQPYPEVEDALSLPILDLLTLCETSRRYADICNDNRFWADRLRRDFPNLLFSPDEDLKDLYLRMV